MKHRATSSAARESIDALAQAKTPTTALLHDACDIR
jgi:hypothetical protein